MPTPFLAERLRDTVPWSYGTHADIDAALMQADSARLWAEIPNGHKWLNYFPIYDEVFARFRGQAPRVLEIGVYYGGSIQLWQRFFGPGTRFVAIDIEERCRSYDDPDNGVHVMIGDQSDPAFLAEVICRHGPFDVIIDDGSHVISHQIASFNALIEEGVRPGGIYFVEDVETSFWGHRTLQNDTGFRFTEFAFNIAEMMHWPYLSCDYHAFVKADIENTSVPAPRITTLVSGVRFYDSIVVFDRGTPLPPVVENLAKA